MDIILNNISVSICLARPMSRITPLATKNPSNSQIGHVVKRSREFFNPKFNSSKSVRGIIVADGG